MAGSTTNKRTITWSTFLLGCFSSFLLGSQLAIYPILREALGKSFTYQQDEPVIPVGPSSDLIGKSVWDVAPFEHTPHVEFPDGKKTDAFNPFYNYLYQLGEERGVHFPNLPFFHSWFHFFEAYHNHLHRFRKQEKVVFMEIGVQSGGKIPLLRDYFGPGFVYIGIDINPSTKMFESANWVHIEIGNSEDRAFLRKMKEKYPYVDIFLDDGGHTMTQQRVALEEMLPHVQPEGVYIIEDLSTSWSPKFEGINNADIRNEDFREQTTVGLIHRTLDWLNSDWITGGVMKPKQPEDKFYSETWWKTVPEQVKHIHFYNQLVVYEKGFTYEAKDLKTVGMIIPYKASGVHQPVDWDPILKKLQNFTGSSWQW